MKIFGAHYWTVREDCCGNNETANLVIVAASRSDALGMALMHVPDSEARDWELVEVDPAVHGVTDLSEAYLAKGTP